MHGAGAWGQPSSTSPPEPAFEPFLPSACGGRAPQTLSFLEEGEEGGRLGGKEGWGWKDSGRHQTNRELGWEKGKTEEETHWTKDEGSAGEIEGGG